MEVSDSQELSQEIESVERTTPTNVCEILDVEKLGSINDDEPPLSFADLGIPSGPQLHCTRYGKWRKLEDLERKEFAFVLIAGVGILVTLGFTVYKCTQVKYNSPDFIFANVLFANTGFCIFYLISGVVRERPYQMFILVSTTLINLLYLIVNFALSIRDTAKLVRLIVACSIGPVVVVLGVQIGFKYLVSGNLVFRTVGANPILQSMCRTMNLFFDLLTFDLQLGFTVNILILTYFNNLDIVVVTVGVFITIFWFSLGAMAVRRECKPAVIVFWALSPLKLAYIVYKLIQASWRFKIAESVAAVSLAACILALITRIAVIVLMFFVYRNFGHGLKEKAFGSAGKGDKTNIVNTEDKSPNSLWNCCLHVCQTSCNGRKPHCQERGAPTA